MNPSAACTIIVRMRSERIAIVFSVVSVAGINGAVEKEQMGYGTICAVVVAAAKWR